MAEFLIKAEDSPVPDGPGKWYAARIVVVQDDGHSWGGKEGPPKFFIAKVPGVTKGQGEQYLEEWRHNTSINILDSDQTADSYRLRVISDRVSISGKNAFSEAQIGQFFDDWNATIVSFQNDRVTFDLSVFGAITSKRFWGRDVSGVVFVETSYVQATGDHVVLIQDSPFTAEQIQQAVEAKGGTFIAPRSFVMNRSVARQTLTDDINARIKDIAYARRRWYITASGIAALQAAGGVITLTPQQFINNVVDGLDD